MSINPAFRALICACLLAGGLTPLVASAVDRPNVVFIISDDHDFEMLGFMGHSSVRTPTLDNLAASGSVFTRAHLPMSRCHPTLASFLSGRWPHQSGIYYNYGTEKLSPKNSLPNLLKQAGYATYIEGKYWEGDPREMGFTHGAGKTAGSFVRKGQGDLFGFIDEVHERQPFFVWWAPKIPHTPHNPPQKHLDKYAPKDIKVPGYVTKENRESFLEREHKSLAMVSWLDEGMTEFTAKLKSVGEYENTLFVFVIDNGWCNGLVSKGSPFERGVRTPVFVSWPGKTKGEQRFDDLISTHDIYPTILDYAGVRIPETAVGRSLRPRIEGRPHKTRDRLHGAIYPATATKGDERAERDVYAMYVRTEKWKYIRYVRDVPQPGFRIQSICTDALERSAGDEDLYDLEQDPNELNNLAGRKNQAKRLAEFRAEVQNWWSETGGKPLAASDAKVAESKATSKQVERKPKEKKKRKKKGSKQASTPKPFLPKGETIVASMYCANDGVLKMTVILDFESEKKGETVALEIEKDGRWKQVAEAPIIVDGYSAHFRVEDWDQSRTTRYRVRHAGSIWGGTIQRDPIGKDTIVIAGFSCNGGASSDKSDIVRHVKAHNPDLLAFTGDQVYGSNHRETFPQGFCLPFRDLLRDIPSVLMPDDHDVGQGNLWGDGGENYSDIDYAKMVHRVQTSHLPDPHDPTPVAKGLPVYYGGLRVGAVGVAIVEDRKFKSDYRKFWEKGNLVAPDDSDFSPAKVDHPDAVLLGERQLKFLREWSADWRGTEMKLVLAQTIFASAATHIGGKAKPVLADFDTNGWPQKGRNQALAEIRRGFAITLCGDQHLGTLTRHGIDDWGDAGYSLCVPAIHNIFPRRWNPSKPGANQPAGMPDYTGDYMDGFGNKITMLAAANPESVDPGRDRVHRNAPGYGILRFHCDTRKIEIECWPRYADPRDPSTGGQYPGWPVTIDQEDNYGREAVGFLPEVQVEGLAKPVIQVVNEATAEAVYTIRARTHRHRAKVFAEGSYTLRVGDADWNTTKTITGLKVTPGSSGDRITLRF